MRTRLFLGLSHDNFPCCVWFKSPTIEFETSANKFKTSVIVFKTSVIEFGTSTNKFQTATELFKASGMKFWPRTLRNSPRSSSGISQGISNWQDALGKSIFPRVGRPSGSFLSRLPGISTTFEWKPSFLKKIPSRPGQSSCGDFSIAAVNRRNGSER